MLVLKGISAWFENLSEEKQYNIEQNFGSENSIYCVEMGYETDEGVSYGYFKNESSIFAYVHEFEGLYILSYDDCCYDEMKAYDNKEEAITELMKLEDTLYTPIPKQIGKFMKDLGEYSNRIEVRVKEEYNNSGHFYSFRLLLDGVFFDCDLFYLDAEKVIEKIESEDEE